jgi:hypothetical protein
VPAWKAAAGRRGGTGTCFVAAWEASIALLLRQLVNAKQQRASGTNSGVDATGPA